MKPSIKTAIARSLELLREGKADKSLADLVAGTRVVNPLMLDRSDPYNYEFSDTKLYANKRFKALQCTTTIHRKDSERSYRCVIDFFGIEEGEKPSFSRSPCRVSCQCRAYYFYFAFYNTKKDAHARGHMRPYVPKPPPKKKVGPWNPNHVPGVCKHLAAFGQLLLDSKEISP